MSEGLKKCGEMSSSGGRPSALLCGLCLLSMAVTGYFGYRETLLESRLVLLEKRLQSQLSSPVVDQHVVVERLRRAVANQLMNTRRLYLQPPQPSDIVRRVARDATADCKCPPGKLHPLHLILHKVQVFKLSD